MKTPEFTERRQDIEHLYHLAFLSMTLYKVPAPFGWTTEEHIHYCKEVREEMRRELAKLYTFDKERHL